MAIATAGAPDLAAIKQRQQATWSSGDYHMIGTQIQIVSELLIEALDVHSTERVLDVATGSGNAALAAARRGCSVIGVDYVPALLDARRARRSRGPRGRVRRGRRRGPAVRRREFDVVSSVFGAMFAPDQERTARARPRHPARWPDRARRPHARGFIGQLFKTNAKHVPPPAGVRSPIQWGTDDGSRSCSGTRSPTCASKSAITRSATARRRVHRVLARYYGPTLKSFEAVGDAGREALEADLLALIERFNRARTARWSCRASTSRRSSSRADPATTSGPFGAASP